MAFELVIMYKFWLSTRDFTRVMEDLSPTPAATGTIAPHLHRGRHRRAAQDALLTDERYRAPEPFDDPGFQPYPQPQYDRLEPHGAFDVHGGAAPHGSLPHGTVPGGHVPQVFTQPFPVLHDETPWTGNEGHWR
jgi:hypothetical protein